MGKRKPGPRLMKIQWPPKPQKAEADVDGCYTLYPGEPIIIDLFRFRNDRALNGSTDLSCCDCGLRHHITYSVLRAPDNLFYLIVRNYRDDGATDIIGKNKRKRLKKKWR